MKFALYAYATVVPATTISVAMYELAPCWLLAKHALQGLIMTHELCNARHPPLPHMHVAGTIWEHHP